MLETEFLRSQQSRLLKHSVKIKKVYEHPQQLKLLKKVVKLEKRVKQQLNRRNELSVWSLQNYLISLRIKVRLMEDLVSAIQRYQVVPDAKLEAAISEMILIRDQTYQDLHEIVKNREKTHWREWDKFKITNLQTDRLIQMELCKEIEQQEVVLQRLIDDQEFQNGLLQRIVKFVKEQLGGEGWLKLFNLVQFRLKQPVAPDQNQANRSNPVSEDQIVAQSNTNKADVVGISKVEGSIKESKWVQALQKEKHLEQQDALQQKKVRQARLASLFEELESGQSDDDLVVDRLDGLAVNEHMNKFLQKVDHHLDLERVLISNWNQQLV